MTNLSQLYPTIESNTVPEYSAIIVYMTNDIINYNGTLYKSLVDNNINHLPNEPDSTYWEENTSGGGNFTKDLFLLDVGYTTAQVISTFNTGVTLVFDNVQIDKENGYNTSTGKWTASRDMDIRVDCNAGFAYDGNSTKYFHLEVQYNDETVAIFNDSLASTQSTGDGRGGSISAVLRISAGDTIHAIVSCDGDSRSMTSWSCLQITELIAGTIASTDELQEGSDIDPTTSFVRTYNGDTEQEEKVSLDKLRGDLTEGPIAATGKFYWDGSNIVILSSTNIASIVRNDVGNYTVTFDKPMADTNYIVSVASDSSSGGARNYADGYTTTDANSFIIMRESSDGDASDYGDPGGACSFSVIRSDWDGSYKGIGGNFTKDTGLLKVALSSEQSISTSDYHKILFDNIQWDTLNSFDISNSRWVAPRDMKIAVRASLGTGGNVSDANIYIYIDGTRSFSGGRYDNSGFARAEIIETINVIQGNVIEIYYWIGASDSGLKEGSTSLEITELIAGTFDPSNIITGAVELENDEYICDGTENSVTIDVSNFESDDLEILYSMKSAANSTAGLSMRFNSDTTNSYSSVRWYSDSDTSDASTSYDGNDISYMSIGQLDGTDYPHYMSSGVITLTGFKSTSMYKNIVGIASSHSDLLYFDRYSGIWKCTDAITTITLFTNSGGNFATGSRIKIYGKQTSAYPVVEGNEITVMQKIREIDVESDTTSVEFAGLDGDKDIEYKLIANITTPSDADNMTYYVRPNNDSSSSYKRRYLDGQETNASTQQTDETGWRVGGGFNDGTELSFSENIIKATTGSVRYMSSRYSYYITADGVGAVGVWGQVWNNTVDNITSLTITTGNATPGAIVAGSHFELWAVRTVKIGGSNQNDMIGAIVTTGEYDTSVGDVGGNTMYYPSSITKEYDSGSCYDENTGTFIVPESGWYRINLWLSFPNTSGRTIWNFQKNGDTANYPPEFYDFNAATYTNSSCSMTKKLEKGDTYRFLNRRDVVAYNSQQEFIKIG